MLFRSRARYLAALERGEWRELPGAVYTKGFLRNYALYLGLDPEEILLQWHQERRDPAPGEAAIVVPRAIEAPRPGITITPGVFAGVLLALAVGAFALYLGMQLFRFAKPPSVEVTDPSVATVSVDESTSTYVLRGTASPGASITVIAPGRDAIRGNVDADGFWAIEVELRRGRNQFKVSVTDPETGKIDDALKTLSGFAVGMPVVIEETFPLKCSPEELQQFFAKSKAHASGWIGFYWGSPPEELRKSGTIADAITLGWLELFQKGAPK